MPVSSAHRTQLLHTCALGRLDGGESNAPQTEQFEEGGRLLVEPAQLPLCSRQVGTATGEHEDAIVRTWTTEAR